jgi:cytochrome P450
MDWRPAEAWEDFEGSPQAGTAAVYGPLLEHSPVVRIPADGVPGGAKHDFVGILGFEEVAKAAADFTSFSSVTTEECPWIVPLQSDPPEHAKYRRGLDRYFQAAAVSRLETEVRPFCEEMVGAMVAAGRADYATEFSGPFPTRVLCRFLGLPDEDWKVHHDWVMAMEQETGDGLADDRVAVPTELAERILPYVREVVARRRAEPGDDIVTGMVDLEIEGRPLDDEDVCFLLITFMMGGHITTSSAIGSLALRLATEPGLQDLLRAEPERIPDAVEESLRIDTPQQAMPRRCTHRTEVAGHQIDAGELVLLNYGSANVDPGHWETPQVFELGREDKRHLAFGRGPHRCIAAAMARMELRIAIETLLAMTGSFEVAGEVMRFAWPRMAVDELPLAFAASPDVP